MMLKELPGLKNLNIENNNLDIVNLKADVFEIKLEKLNTGQKVLYSHILNL